MVKINSSLIVSIILLIIPFLSFAGVFTSQADGDWHDPATWGEISATPTSADDVIIDGHQISITTGGATVNTLTITNASTGISKLDINGSLVFNVNGDLTLTATNVAYDVSLIIRSTSIVNIGGNMLIERSADNIQLNSLQLKIYNSGQLLITGGFTYLYRNGLESSIDVEIYDTAIFSASEDSFIQQESGNYLTFNVYGTSQATFEKNLTISNSGGVNNSLNIFSGADTRIDGHLTLYSLADTYDSDINIAAGSKLDLNGNLIMTANADQSVNINMTGTSKLYIAGNVSRTNNFGKLDMQATSELYFDGASAQSVPKEVMPSAGVDIFNYSNVIFQNSSATGLTLDGDITVTGHMTLTDGIVSTTSSAILIIDNLATIDPGSSSSYIDGPIIKRGSTNGSSFTFPTGDNGIFAPVTIEAIADTELEYTAEYIGCPPPTVNLLNLPLKALNSQGYWSLERSDGASVGNITLHWNDADATGINDLSSLVVSYYIPVMGWYSIGKGGTSGNIGVGVGGSIFNDIGCPPPTVANLFGLGSTEPELNVLPVELIGFRAFKNNDHSSVFLEWETASEENSDHFIIEKSIDGATFYEIGRVQAAQNSTTIQFYSAVDNQPNKGNNYYRIQQVDQDEIMNFSRLINVFLNDQTDKPIIFPNPVKDFVRVYSSSLNGQEVNIKVLDITGKCLYTNSHYVQDGQIYLSTANMNIKNSGIYFINYEDKGQVYSLKFMKM
jgi:type IX secretion system substrate protein